MRQGIWVRLFDLHCDTPSYCFRHGCSVRHHDGAVDLHRGKCFSPWNQAFAAFLPDGLEPTEARRLCTNLVDTVCGWEQESDFRLIRHRMDLDDALTGCRGLLTVENGGAIGEEFSFLDYLARRGVRVMGLTWNGKNCWASGCMAGDDGLSSVGCQAISHIERLDITVDVSHLNETCFWQVVRQCTKPIIASHSNASSVCAHPRNLSDEQFCAIRDGGGVVGLNLYAPHLGNGDVLLNFRRHLEHFLSLNGEHCICIGSDLDGMNIPSDWNGMNILRKLWKFLQTAGYPDSLLEDIFYNNAHNFFYRVLN